MFIIVDNFIKQEYVIVYTKEILAEDIVQIYIKEVFIRYKVLAKIISDRDMRFIIIFQKVFIAEQGIKAVILIEYCL